MSRQEEFKQKLFALLREYDVEMKVEVDVDGEYMASAQKLIPSTEAIYENGEKVQEPIDFQVGVWEDGK